MPGQLEIFVIVLVAMQGAGPFDLEVPRGQGFFETEAGAFGMHRLGIGPFPENLVLIDYLDAVEFQIPDP